MSNNFVFPTDAVGKAGAIRTTSDGNNFYIPVVVFGPDGITPMATANMITQLDSTTTPLSAAMSYTTPSPFSISSYRAIVGSVFADQPGSLMIEQSWDGTNFDIQSTIDVTSNTPQGFTIEVVGLYGRLSYLNGSNAQTQFRLYAGGKTL